MAKAKAAKAVAVKAAQSREQMEQLVEEMGKLQREVADIETRMNTVLAKVQADFKTEAAPLNARIAEVFELIHGYASAHRSELCKEGSKTAQLTTGELSWRITPPSVSVTGPDVVITTLKRLGLDRFIRTKEELNKEAILSEREAVDGVKGITIGQKEEFVVKPFASEIERAATSRKNHVEA